jgi:HD-like signal output (HDOD) protein
MRHLLFVDDEPHVLDGIKRAIRRQRHLWEAAFASGGDSALALMATTPFDVIVSDMSMPRMDGAALLKEVQRRHPEVIRIILTGSADPGAALRAVPLAHQYLIKPFDAQTLGTTVERACSLQSILTSPTLARMLGSISKLPCASQVLVALEQAMSEPGSTLETIGGIIEGDVGLSAKILQLANSEFFGGLQGGIGVRSAVNHLGTDVIRSLLVSSEMFQAFDQIEIEGFSMDRFQRHGQMVARIAASFPLPAHLADAATTAGLLHDIGKLVIASRLPTAFRAAIANSVKRQRPLYEMEEEQYGVSHAEVGAYLLALWGFSPLVTEAVAHHHHPDRISHSGMDAVTALYLADHLANEFEQGEESNPFK